MADNKKKKEEPAKKKGLLGKLIDKVSKSMVSGDKAPEKKSSKAKEGTAPAASKPRAESKRTSAGEQKDKKKAKPAAKKAAPAKPSAKKAEKKTKPAAAPQKAAPKAKEKPKAKPAPAAKAKSPKAETAKPAAKPAKKAPAAKKPAPPAQTAKAKPAPKVAKPPAAPAAQPPAPPAQKGSRAKPAPAAPAAKAKPPKKAASAAAKKQDKSTTTQEKVPAKPAPAAAAPRPAAKKAAPAPSSPAPKETRMPKEPPAAQPRAVKVGSPDSEDTSSRAHIARFELEPTRPHEEPKYDTEEGELPDTYGDTQLVMLVRDPEWVYVYWDVSDHLRRQHGLARDRHSRATALRILELGPEGNPLGHFDIPVDDSSTHGYYLRLEPLKHYAAEFGYYDPLGRYVPVAQSGPVSTPRATPSDATDAAPRPAGDAVAGAQEDQLAQRMFELSGGRELRYLQVGSEFLPIEVPEGAKVGVVSSEVRHFGASEQLAMGSSDLVAQKQPGEKATDFWLRVRTELILYGETESDANVTVMGQAVKLRPDGTFTLRFALPEGHYDLPVRAVNAEGDMEKSVKPVVDRSTEDENL